jgi:hypothetical protein
MGAFHNRSSGRPDVCGSPAAAPLVDPQRVIVTTAASQAPVALPVAV